MKKLISTVALAGLGLGSLNAQNVVQDTVADLSISGTFDFESQYIFRGKQRGWQSFQPGVEFGYPIMGGEAYAGVWTNQQIDNKAAFYQDEVDFYAGYAYPVTDMFVLDAGFTYYWFSSNNARPANAFGPSFSSGPARQNREIYVGATADVIMSPAVYFYYDFDQNQTVIEGSVGYSFDLGEYAGIGGLAIDLGAYYGWLNAKRAYGMTGAGVDNGYMYGGATVDFVYSISQNVSASVGARWSANNDGKTAVNAGGLPINQGARENNIWFGASIGFAY
jgi:uncharacterized protein (TIGR02001 family)